MPDDPFPPYSYITGQFPHPTRDPAGHSFGAAPVTCIPPDPNRWHECRSYLRGLDLFNHGYYWEAHEVWEGVWHACGRGGLIGDFFKGLIKLAAAGVKARENRPEGVRRHARRAAELFRQLASRLPAGQTCYFGLPLQQLINLATEVTGRSAGLIVPVGTPVQIVFKFVLCPEETVQTNIGPSG